MIYSPFDINRFLPFSLLSHEKGGTDRNQRTASSAQADSSTSQSTSNCCCKLARTDLSGSVRHFMSLWVQLESWALTIEGADKAETGTKAITGEYRQR